MAFLNIVPYTKQYMDWNVESIPLRIVYGDGVDYSPDVKVNVTDLNNGQKRFLNVSGDGDSFRVKVLVNKNDTVQGKLETKEEMQYGYYHGMYGWYGGGTKVSFKQFNLIEALDYWIRNGETFLVTSDGDAVDIQDGRYIVTANSSRKQSARGGYSVWDLEFTKYAPLTYGTFKNDNTYVNKAKKAYEKQKSKNKKSTSKNTTTKVTIKGKVKDFKSVQNKLKKCKVCKIQYTKNKKNTCICTSYVQYLLKKTGYYDYNWDGWYGPATVTAVKKFQKDFKKKYNLTVNGKVDKKTLNALCKVG